MRVKMSFEGGAFALLGWFLLMYIMTLALFIPGAWGLCMLYQFIARSIVVSDGSKVSFNGTGGQLLKLFAIAMAVPLVGVGIIMALIMPYANSQTETPPSWVIAIVVLLYIVILPWSFYFGFRIMKWVVESFELSGSGKLTFTATIWGYLGWTLLVMLAYVCLILPVFWAANAMFRWFLEKIQTASGDKLVWTGTGWGLLWRIVVMYLACMFIIPIPWMMKWFLGWIVSSVEIEKAAGAAPAPAIQGSPWAQAVSS